MKAWYWFKIFTWIAAVVSLLAAGALAYTPWQVPGVKILPRSARGADETLKYASHPVYQQYLEQLEREKKELEELKKTNPALYEQKIKAIQIEQARNEYLLKNFPEEFKIDKIITGENGNELWTPRAYHYDKIKIIIHHTAWGEDIKTPEDAKAYIRNIYRFHALTRKRWDIGYNFLIDPWGNIYEWRSGGEGVVGMHAKYNNTASVGIALIGNLDESKPTKDQLIALIKLVAGLSAKYRLDPLASWSVVYHKKWSSEPYIKDFWFYPVGGHQDAGWTSCPWKNLYPLMPKIREASAYLLKKSVRLAKADEADKVVDQKDKLISQVWKEKIYKRLGRSVAFDRFFEFEVEVPKGFKLQKCELVEGQKVKIVKCRQEDGKVNVRLERKWWKATWNVKILLEGKFKNIYVTKPIVWIEDLTKYALARKQKYLQTHKVDLASYPNQKIESKISLSKQRYLQKNGEVRVLLWEASFLPKRQLRCENWCKVKVGKKEFEAKEVLVKPAEDGFEVIFDGRRLNGAEIQVQDAGSGLVEIAGYSRKSYAWVPWNVFRWKLMFARQRMKMLDGSWQLKPAVINVLSFDEYMRWVAEANDQMPLEKAKVMALLAKSYMLFYLEGDNTHPSIPKGAKYNAIDDPRFFQKYVGAWFEKTSKNRAKARQRAKARYAVYEGYLPILPYFNCSVGFTWSAREKFWWTDTPYLRTRLDFASCEDFNGHWVGLSGKWAEVLAKKWANAVFILKYFYPGVEVVR